MLLIPDTSTCSSSSDKPAIIFKVFFVSIQYNNRYYYNIKNKREENKQKQQQIVLTEVT